MLPLACPVNLFASRQLPSKRQLTRPACSSSLVSALFLFLAACWAVLLPCTDRLSGSCTCPFPDAPDLPASPGLT